MRDFFEILEPSLFCSVGLLAGSGGAGRVGKQKQTSESGTNLYKGLGQYDEFARSFGAAPTIANFDPTRTTQLPERRFAQIGAPQTVERQFDHPQYGYGSGAASSPQVAFGKAQQPQYQQYQQGPNPNAIRASTPQVTAGGGGGVQTGGGGATYPTKIGTNSTDPDYQTGGTNYGPYVPTENKGLDIVLPGKQVQRAFQAEYGKKATFPQGVPGVEYNLSPEELNFRLQEQQQQTFSAAGIPTAARTQDYGDALRLPNPETVFTQDTYDKGAELGFFGNNQQVEAQGQYGDIGQVRGAQANAAQIATSGPEFQKFSNDIYESQFRPVQRELSRQEEIGQRSLKAQLANAGLATSGTGIAQESELSRDFNQRLQDSSTDAANRASAQAFGLRQEQIITNAGNQQQTNLANAGFNQQAQITNAGNLLTRQGQVDQNYLAAMGLNIQQAEQVRNGFLQWIGMEAADMERMDTGTRQNVEMMFNNYLNLMTTVGNLGRYSSGEAQSTGPGALISY